MPLQKSPNPVALDARVVQHSFRFDPSTIRLDEVEALGVPLPDSLKGAVAKRRIEWTLGRYCARLACQDLDPAFPGEIGTRADRGPQWPADLVGSITHTSGFVSAAVARRQKARGIGIDSEGILTAETLAEVREAVASPREQAPSEVQAALTELPYFTLIFSAKESLYKCLAPLVGRFFGYEDAEIGGIDLPGKRFQARLITGLSAEFPAGAELSGRFAIVGPHVHTAILLGETPCS